MEASYGVASSGGLSFTSRIRILSAEWDAMVWLSIGGKNKQQRNPFRHHLIAEGAVGDVRSELPSIHLQKIPNSGVLQWMHFSHKLSMAYF